MASNPFHENAVVLTGASSGIGRELALQLAKQGAALALAARNIDLLPIRCMALLNAMHLPPASVGTTLAIRAPAPCYQFLLSPGYVIACRCLCIE